MKLRSVAVIAVMIFFGTFGLGAANAESSATAIVPSPNSSTILDNSLESVDCVSDSFCVAVGSFNDGATEQTLVLNWDGVSWSTTPSPNNSSTQHHLASVSCVSQSFCMSGGFFSSGTGVEPLTMKWDGSSWTIVPNSLSMPGQFAMLNSISCLSKTFCLAVGSVGQVPMQTLIMTWDGTNWTQIPSPNTSQSLANSLIGASCVTTTFCVAVGFHNDGTSYLTLALTWNGSSWAQVPSPNPWRGTSPSQNNSLRSVSCLTESNCTAVGTYGYLSGGRSLVISWDGSQWLQVESPDPTIYSSPLVSVSCVSDASCAAVGSFKEYGVTLSQPLVVWSGPAWQQQAAPSAGSALNELAGVSCVSASNCFAVGYYQNGSAKQTLIMSLVRPAPIATPTFTG